MAKREKTVTRSFRMSESAFLALQQEASRRNISVNTLHNLLLLTFAEYDRYMNEFHMVKLSSTTFRRIMNAASPEAIAEAGRVAGKNVPASFILAKDGKITEETCIEYLRLLGQYASLFQFNVVRDESTTVLTLVHDLGENGSIFLSEYAKSIFELIGIKTKVTQSGSSTTLELLKPQPRM